MKVGDGRSYYFVWDYREVDIHLVEVVESSFLIIGVL